MQTSIKITKNEFAQRAEKLLSVIQKEKLNGVILFDNYYILYFCGFTFIPTERPMAFLMNTKGEKGLFVPRLEVEHAETNASVNRVSSYIEYPYDPHPMVLFKDFLEEMGMKNTIGSDQDGYPWILGYRGPSLSEILNESPKIITSIIEDQMMIKSKAEVDLIRESVKWGHLAHTLLQRYTKVNLTETEVSTRASMDANLTMLDTIGPIYKAQSAFSRGASAGYRGQIGRNSAIPHALANNITFQPGDVLVTGAGAPVWGYHSELERTMIIGPATKEQKQLFDHMVNLQDTAFKAMQPGLPCAIVDQATRDYYEKYKLNKYWKHHTGHAIGLRYHEAPFLDIGDNTIMQPGMVFTVEPGLYHPGLGGFRHSDTVMITDDGIEILTYYPRDLESLTIPI
ncbi:MAG: Xaa-Pro peptidase family protein [Anaerolineales bacterium]|jgi:Xaa-Pro aminopeptidase